MNSPIRLRLACQFALSRSLRSAPKSSPVPSRLRAPVLLGEYSRHFTSSVQYSGANRFTSELESSENDELSQFKKQRQAEFQEDANSEEPLFPDPYPRLEKPKHERKSVSDFLASFHGEAKEAPKEVTLYGRIRSKRSAGKALIFVDIVHEFRKVQVMINRSNLFIRSEDGINKFSLFKKMIQVGDHICKLDRSHPFTVVVADANCSRSWYCFANQGGRDDPERYRHAQTSRPNHGADSQDAQ